jgi:hypothetical protein
MSSSGRRLPGTGGNGQVWAITTAVGELPHDRGAPSASGIALAGPAFTEASASLPAMGGAPPGRSVPRHYALTSLTHATALAAAGKFSSAAMSSSQLYGMPLTVSAHNP